jgi:hypothetical protein
MVRLNRGHDGAASLTLGSQSNSGWRPASPLRTVPVIVGSPDSGVEGGAASASRMATVTSYGAVLAAGLAGGPCNGMTGDPIGSTTTRVPVAEPGPIWPVSLPSAPKYSTV